MAVNLIGKLLYEAVKTGGTYAKFVVTEENVAFICNGGFRKSTKNYRQSKKEITVDERVLKSISEKNLIFSAQLSRIEFTLHDGRTAVFQRDTNGSFCTIKARRVTETKEKVYEYVCFSSDDEISTGLAFALKQPKNGKYQITPCTGEIMNGVKSVGIPTDLKFVISGKFQIKDGVTDPWADQVNMDAVEQLSAVFESALKNTIHLGLLGMPLFSVLPNSMDEENLLNTSLLQTARRVCASYPMFQNRSGRIVNRSRIAYGTDDVTKLFPQEIAGPFLGERYWARPCESGSREECFLRNISVPYYDREQFLKRVFSEENIEECERLLKRQNDKWLREFYILCSEPLIDSAVKKQIIAGFKSIQSIRDPNGEMHFPYEVMCITTVKQFSKKSLVIKPELISPSGEDDEHSEQLREFFLKGIGIKEYSQKAEIEELAKSLMNKKQSVDKAYINKLLLLAQYDEAHRGEVDFQSYAIFPYDSSRGIRRGRACELVIGKPYIREGDLLASATGRNSLWKGFSKIISNEELELILNFAERNGAIGLPKIIKRTAEKHRDFESKLFAVGKQGSRDSNFDYIIPGLEQILKKRSLKLNRLVWASLLEADNNDVLTAEYSVDNRRIVNRCESSLILILRERTWIPGKDGKFYMPENIATNDISEEFDFPKDNPILKSLQFGSGIEKKIKAFKEMEKFAARQGLRIITEQEYQEFLIWKQGRNLK